MRIPGSPSSWWPYCGDETAYTLDTYPGHSLDTCDISIHFPMHFCSIFDYFDISGVSRILNVSAILHVELKSTATHSQSHRSMLHLYSILPTFGLSYHWRLRYFRLYHMAIDYYCDALLKR